MFSLAFETALRSIVRTPGVSLLVIMAIALGVGMTMPMVTLYHNSNGNPYPDTGDKMYRVLIDNWFLDQIFWFTAPDMPTEIMTARDARVLMRSDIPTKVAASYEAQQYIRSVDPEMGVKPFASAIRVTTSGFFEMFEVPMRFGAAWGSNADGSNENIAVISHSTNLTLFGGGDNVGRDFKIGDQIYTVVGIMHAWSLAPRVYDLTQTSARTEGVFVPLSDFQRSRLKPGRFVSLEGSPSNEFGLDFLGGETIFANLWVQLDTKEQVQSYRDFMDSYVKEQKKLGRLPRPTNNRLYSATEWIVVAPVNAQQRDIYKTFILVGVLFLVVCLFNLLSLLLSKFMSITPQACVTRALGATRADIFLQYVVEVLVLGVVGGLLSIYVSKAALFGIVWVYIENLPPEFKQIQSQVGVESPYVQFDTTLLVMSFCLALLAALVSALYPAWRACRVPPAEHLKVN